MSIPIIYIFFAFFSLPLLKAATSAGKKRKSITKRELNERAMPKKKCKECTNKIIKIEKQPRRMQNNTKKSYETGYFNFYVSCPLLHCVPAP